jgi:hypothetical protein
MSFTIMSHLVNYYLRQAGQGGDIGPIYSVLPFIERRHGIGSFLGGLWRSIRSILWSGAKHFGKETLRSLGRETLRTGGKILKDIAENEFSDFTTHDIISKNLSESTQNLIGRIRGRGRKRKPTTSKATASKKQRKRNTSK